MVSAEWTPLSSMHHNRILEQSRLTRTYHSSLSNFRSFATVPDSSADSHLSVYESARVWFLIHNFCLRTYDSTRLRMVPWNFNMTSTTIKNLPFPFILHRFIVTWWSFSCLMHPIYLDISFVKIEMIHSDDCCSHSCWSEEDHWDVHVTYLNRSSQQWILRIDRCHRN